MAKQDKALNPIVCPDYEGNDLDIVKTIKAGGVSGKLSGSTPGWRLMSTIDCSAISVTTNVCASYDIYRTLSATAFAQLDVNIHIINGTLNADLSRASIVLMDGDTTADKFRISFNGKRALIYLDTSSASSYAEYFCVLRSSVNRNDSQTSVITMHNSTASESAAPVSSLNVTFGGLTNESKYHGITYTLYTANGAQGWWYIGKVDATPMVASSQSEVLMRVSCLYPTQYGATPPHAEAKRTVAEIKILLRKGSSLSLANDQTGILVTGGNMPADCFACVPDDANNAVNIYFKSWVTSQRMIFTVLEDAHSTITIHTDIMKFSEVRTLIGDTLPSGAKLGIDVRSAKYAPDGAELMTLNTAQAISAAKTFSVSPLNTSSISATDNSTKMPSTAQIRQLTGDFAATVAATKALVPAEYGAYSNAYSSLPTGAYGLYVLSIDYIYVKLYLLIEPGYDDDSGLQAWSSVGTDMVNGGTYCCNPVGNLYKLNETTGVWEVYPNDAYVHWGRYEIKRGTV